MVKEPHSQDCPVRVAVFSSVRRIPLFRFSVSNDLKYDAERDLRDIGAKNIQVHSLNKVRPSAADPLQALSFIC